MLNSNLFCTCLYNNSILKNKTMVKKQALTCNQYILVIVFLNQIQVWLFVNLFAAKTTSSHLRISSLPNFTNLLLLIFFFFRYNDDVFNAGLLHASIADIRSMQKETSSINWVNHPSLFKRIGIWDHSFSTYAKFSEKVTCLTP